MQSSLYSNLEMARIVYLNRRRPQEYIRCASPASRIKEISIPRQTKKKQTIIILIHLSDILKLCIVCICMYISTNSIRDRHTKR